MNTLPDFGWSQTIPTRKDEGIFTQTTLDRRITTKTNSKTPHLTGDAIESVANAILEGLVTSFEITDREMELLIMAATIRLARSRGAEKAERLSSAGSIKDMITVITLEDF